MQDIGGEVLCVSQFTLLANTSKGNKPDFRKAMVSRQSIYILNYTPAHSIRRNLFQPCMSILSQASESSRDLYASFLEKMVKLYRPDRIKGNYSALRSPSYQ